MDPHSQPKYDNVPLEDHDEAGSNTEVDESLMGDEKKWHEHDFQTQRKRSARCRVISALRSGANTLLLLAILGLLVRQQLQTPPRNQWDFGGDFTGVAPAFNQKITTFAMEYKYQRENTSEFFTDEVMHAWNDLMPRGMGFQSVNDTSPYHDLPTPIEWPDQTVFTTSMTHQLHCLFAIVRVYSGLKSNHELPSDHEWHMIHCFSYLRQAIMCSADMALEGHETTFPDHNGGSDGWDSKHVCRDYDQVISYLESVRAYDDRLIY